MNIKLNVRMAELTSFRIGGPADILLEIENFYELENIMKFINTYKIPFLVIGKGTNLLVKDNGIKGIVIKLKNEFSKIMINDEIVTAGSAALLSDLVKTCIKNELTGLEFCAGIPGTVGGAVVMNAGVPGYEIKDVIHRIYVFTKDKMKILKKEEVKFGYRESEFQRKNDIITKVEFKLKKDLKENCFNKFKMFLEKRKNQPKGASAGCIFKNPKGISAGELIEKCLLKGKTKGDIQISKVHGNFFINLGNGNAKDVIELIKEVQKVVKEKTKISLKPEIRIVGW
jgi:UDP-N-acetylmuramate dehydrogenase